MWDYLSVKTKINNIKNKVVTYKHPDGRLTVYINIRTTRKVKVLDKNGNKTGKIKIENKSLFDIQHNLRFRSMIYNCVVCSYHPEMDFTLAESLGWFTI